MSTERMQAMLAAACFGTEEDFRDDLAGFLARHEIEAEDAAALLASPRRLALYRRLVRHNVSSIVDTMLAHTRARLEVHAAGELDRTVAAFLAERGPRTSHLRDVPSELLAFVLPRWRANPGLPRWLADHAIFELVDFTIGIAPRPEPPPPLAEVTADRPLVFAEPKELLYLGWAVNVLSCADLTVEPEPRPVAILAYRDAEHAARFLELTPLAAAILAELFSGQPLGPAMVRACTRLDRPLDDTVLGGAARLLADLGERGILLGARESGRD